MAKRIGTHKGRKYDCITGKTRFRDSQQAKKALTGIHTAPKEQAPYRCYECPNCKGWHLSSSEG